MSCCSAEKEIELDLSTQIDSKPRSHEKALGKAAN